MANSRAKVTKNIEIINEIAEKFLPRLSFYHKCNKSLASFCSTRPEGQQLLVQGNGHKQHALKGAEALSPGQRPGLLRMIAYRPVRAKALKLLTIYKAFALTGRLAGCLYTQGVALG